MDINGETYNGDGCIMSYNHKVSKIIYKISGSISTQDENWKAIVDMYTEKYGDFSVFLSSSSVTVLYKDLPNKQRIYLDYYQCDDFDAGKIVDKTPVYYNEEERQQFIETHKNLLRSIIIMYEDLNVRDIAGEKAKKILDELEAERLKEETKTKKNIENKLRKQDI